MVRLVRLVRTGGLSFGLLVLAPGCSGKDTSPASGSGNAIASGVISAPAQPAPPQPARPAPADAALAVRDEQAKQLLLAASAGDMDAHGYLRTDPKELPRYNAFLGYINAGATNANIVETCLSMFGEAEPRVRSLAAQCVAAGASRVLAKPGRLRAAAIAATLDGLERDPHAGVRLQLAFVLGVLHTLASSQVRPVFAPEVEARVAKLLALFSGQDALHQEIAAHLLRSLFGSRVPDDPATLAPPIEALVLQLVGRDERSDLVTAAFDIAPLIADQTKVCQAIAPHLGAEASSWLQAVSYLTSPHLAEANAQAQACDDLLDPAIDLTIAKCAESAESADSAEYLIILERLDQARALPAATRQRIAKQLWVVRNKVHGDRKIFDPYIRIFAHPRKLRPTPI